MLISKTFDASLICPAEQTVIIDEPIWDATLAELQRLGARLLADDEVGGARRRLVRRRRPPRARRLGQSCAALGAAAGFTADADDKVLLAPLPSDLDELAAHPLVHEKLMPVLGLVRSPGVEHAMRAAEVVLASGGMGHTSAVYATDESRDRRLLGSDPDRADPRQRADRRRRAGRRLQRDDADVLARLRHVGRVGHDRQHQLPQPAERQGGVAAPDAAAVVPRPGGHVLQPRVARAAAAVPRRAGCCSSRTPTPRRAAWPTRSASGSAARCACSAGIEPEPTEEQVRAGVEMLDKLAPDLIVAVGGGSVLDAAKAMRLFHESPDLTLAELTLPFLDARKRVAHYPEVDHAIRLVAVPTTAGTGSEVSPAAVLTAGARKLTLVDYSLVPDVAIVEPRLTLTMPPHMTADTGIDALTHALEAGVSIFASPYTDAFCMQALHLILDALPRAYADGSDLAARTAMSNAATLAGLAFSNAFVGVNHALAHAVGARFGIAHGRANAIFLPHVLRYNAALPRKFMPAPGYTTYVAPDKYAQMAWVHGLGGQTAERPSRAPVRARRRPAGRRWACRAACPSSASPATSSRPRCPISRTPRSPTPACARTRACRWSPSCSSCSRRAGQGCGELRIGTGRWDGWTRQLPPPYGPAS